MAYQVLARKYRPQHFSDVIGQEHVTRTLKNALEQGRTAHGYIFSGHRGIGKTTVARILAMALNCRSVDHPVAEPCGVCDSCTEIRAGNSVDVIEIDAATNRGIDEIRELREAARYRPARDRFKIYILDEAHQITDAAFNALLKTLEEPPAHVVFMLATTQPEDIPQTIRSRCQHFSFHPVRFEDVLNQLRDIVKREGIEADDNSLGLLAEAGDGSMRDALSILDQAIACCGERLTTEIVLELVGAAPSHVIEELMQAVSRNASEDALRLIDKLLREGQSPVHFARQLVRFLRNAIVAKVAGDNSDLLQISPDERARVSRVAQLFAEEDLTRFLNIMLRTHGELGYRQEQRLHLELGVLKMVHAQRLLPLEEVLSQTAGSGGGTGRPTAAPQPAAKPVPRESDRPAAAAARPSPFAADSARKGTIPRQELSPAPSSVRPISSGYSSAVIMGSAAPAGAATSLAEYPPEPMRLEPAAPTRELSAEATAEAAPEELPETPATSASDAEQLRGAVVAALEDASQRMLATMLDGGEWSIAGNELTVKVAASPTVIEMAMGAEPKRLATAAASEAAGRPLKVRVLSGGTAQAPRTSNAASSASTRPNGTGRSRALQDPVVRRMQEKFGAEIRTIIDHRDKR
ncbi:MAG TPA: DNA polymerase III subunit gamma/tau [Terriglobales bacterium]|nr:DNA polymerase III subunit gamma/tau [Terriglobales bacterium]